MLYTVNYIRKLINKIFNVCIFKRNDIDIDYTAQLSGLKYMEIGKSFHAGRYLRLEAVNIYGEKVYMPKIKIKNNVIINDFVHIGCTNYVEIGNDVLMASKIYISDHSHGHYAKNNQSNPLIEPRKRIVTNDKKIIIGDNVWIGESVSILPGVEIGNGAIIGANAVVTKNIPEYSIAVGNPAVVIKKYNFLKKKWEYIDKKEVE